jgi:hypothetical protein
VLIQELGQVIIDAWNEQHPYRYKAHNSQKSKAPTPYGNQRKCSSALAIHADFRLSPQPQNHCHDPQQERGRIADQPQKWDYQKLQEKLLMVIVTSHNQKLPTEVLPYTIIPILSFRRVQRGEICTMPGNGFLAIARNDKPS